MYYVETLRIIRGLKTLAIVIGIIFALSMITLWANHVIGHPLKGGASSAIPLPAIFAGAALVAAIFAFAMGTGLSEENESHLPVAWTKPVSRVRYALTVLGVDALGIVAAFVLVTVVGLAVIVIIGAWRFLIVTPDSAMEALRFVALPLAYYGWIAACCSSLARRGRGISWAVWGGSWLIFVFAAIGFARPWNYIFNALNLLNPAQYGGYEYTSGNTTTHVGMATGQTISVAVGVDLAALSALFVAGVLAGVLQWRRLES